LSLDPVSGELTGEPDPGTGGVYNLTLEAENAVDSDTQAFTLTIGQAPVITSPDEFQCSVGSTCEFSFTASGEPPPTITVSGTLPDGVTFNTGTESLEGVPDAGTGAVYILTVEASNGFPPDDTQDFTLTVTEAPVARDTPDGSIPGDSAPGSVPYHGALDTTLSVADGDGVLLNDDLGFPAAEIADLTPPTSAGGSVVLTVDGGFDYTPPSGFTGIDTFEYCLDNETDPVSCATVEVAVGERPDADDATYPHTVIGNVGIDTTIDSDFSVAGLASGDGISLDLETATNGDAVLNPNGTFTFSPAPGVTGTSATLQYSVSNGFGSETGTVTLNIAADRIWFADTAAAGGGDGRLDSPFDSLADVAAAADATGDRIFLSTGNADYTGGIVLLGGQRLLGQGASGSLSAISGLTLPADSGVPATGGTPPQIVNGGGTGVALDTGNHLNGFAVGDTSGAGISGNDFGTLTVADVIIGGSGAALTLENGSVSGNGFSSVSSSSGARNIHLTEIGGNLVLGGGSLTGATTAAIEVSGGAAAISYAGSITPAGSARPVRVLNRGSGSLELSGDISGSNTLGILLTDSGGSTVAFSGSIDLATGSEPAFVATGGGTITATGAGSALQTTTATALRIENTTIGTDDLRFESISAGTSSNGPTNGIVLDNTGSAGGLVVTGAGATNSGGTIQQTGGSGILATDTANLSLAHMLVTDTTNHGIELTNLSGSANELVEVTVSNYHNSGTNGIRLNNDGTNLGGFNLDGITVSDSDEGDNAFFMLAEGESDMTVAIRSNGATPSSFTSLVNSGVRVNSHSAHSGTINFSLLDANFQDVSTGGGTQPVVIAPFSNSTFNLAIDGNTINNSGLIAFVTGLINVAPGALAAPGPVVTGSISNNTLTNSPGFLGINVVADLFAGPMDMTIDNNSIQGVDNQMGIRVDFRDSSGAGATSRIRIRNNQIGNIDDTAGGNSESIFVDVRGDAAKTVNTLIENNIIVHDGDDFFEAFRVASGRSNETGQVVHNVTVRDNDIAEANPNAAGFRGQGRGVGTLCLNMSGNEFDPSLRDVALNQANSGTFNVTQASAAALESANPGSSAAPTGSVQFDQPACPLP